MGTYMWASATSRTSHVGNAIFGTFSTLLPNMLIKRLTEAPTTGLRLGPNTFKQ